VSAEDKTDNQSATKPAADEEELEVGFFRIHVIG